MVEELNDDTNALGMLRREHNAIQLLLATCNEADQPEFVKEAMVPLLEALKIHATIEREFFFPFIEKYVEEERMLAPQDDNSDIEMLAMKLRDLEPRDPGYDTTLIALTESFQHHCYMEEEYLFLPVEGKDPDTHNALIVLANKMKRKRAEMLNEMRASDIRDSGLTQPDVKQHRRAQLQGRHLEPGRDVLPADGIDYEDTDTTSSGQIIDLGGQVLPDSEQERGLPG